MIDLIRVSFASQSARDQLLQTKQKLVFSGNVDDGEVKSYDGHHQYIFEHISESAPPRIQLAGSLHKYAKGKNDGRFTFRAIKKAIKLFMAEYQVPDNAPIHRLEIGINLPFKCPEVVINSAMLYHGRIGERKYRVDYYGIEWFFIASNKRKYYVVKLYKKREHTLRFELHMEDLRKIKWAGIKVITDLLDDNKLLRVLCYLYSQIEEFFFVPDDPQKKLPFPLSAEWRGYRADSFWEGLLSRECKDTKSRKIKMITAAIHEYDLIDWKKHLKKRFLIEGAKIAGTSVNKLSATFSQLGLQGETVAEPNRDRDRQTDTENVEKTIPILQHPVVANVGWFWNVIIYKCSSYFPLLARGPPSVLSVFLLLMYEYNVALLRPVVSSISLIGMVPVSYRASAWLMALGLDFGRPPFLPRARAAARPSMVRSWVRSRSN